MAQADFYVSPSKEIEQLAVLPQLACVDQLPALGRTDEGARQLARLVHGRGDFRLRAGFVFEFKRSFNFE